MKYLELVFEITIVSTLASQILIFLLLLLSHQISTLLYYQKKSFIIIFKLIDTNIFLRIIYSSGDFDIYLELN